MCHPVATVGARAGEGVGAAQCISCFTFVNVASMGCIAYACSPAHARREGILRWIKKQLGPVAETLTKAKELTAAEGESEALLVAYFDTLDKSDAAYAKFEAAAVDVDMPVYQTSDADVAKAAGVAKGGIVLIKSLEVRPALARTLESVLC
jgi:hypothetical protein